MPISIVDGLEPVTEKAHNYQPSKAGGMLHGFLPLAKAQAVLAQAPVVFHFNGIAVRVSPDSNLEDIASVWMLTHEVNRLKLLHPGN